MPNKLINRLIISLLHHETKNYCFSLRPGSLFLLSFITPKVLALVPAAERQLNLLAEIQPHVPGIIAGWCTEAAVNGDAYTSVER